MSSYADYYRQSNYTPQSDQATFLSNPVYSTQQQSQTPKPPRQEPGHSPPFNPHGPSLPGQFPMSGGGMPRAGGGGQPQYRLGSPTLGTWKGNKAPWLGGGISDTSYRPWPGGGQYPNTTGGYIDPRVLWSLQGGQTQHQQWLNGTAGGGNPYGNQFPWRVQRPLQTYTR